MDASGCLAWGDSSPCPSGFCADAASCGGCNDTCETAGATACVGNELRTCEADAEGCLAWAASGTCPAPAGVPSYSADVGTAVWVDDFSSYADTAALTGAYTGYLRQDFGAVTLGSAGVARFEVYWHFDDPVYSCTDSDVLIEHAETVTAPSTIYWHIRKRWSASYTFVDYPNVDECPARLANKQFIVFRPGGQGRITMGVNFSPASPEIHGRLDDLRWSFTVDLEGAQAKTYYRQHLADGPGEKLPNDLLDGQWHDIVVQWTRESSAGAGDGIIKMWIDGAPVMSYDGTYPADAAYGRVYSRSLGWSSFDGPSVINQGPAQDQHEDWDVVEVWY